MTFFLPVCSLSLNLPDWVLGSSKSGALSPTSRAATRFGAQASNAAVRKAKIGLLMGVFLSETMKARSRTTTGRILFHLLEIDALVHRQSLQIAAQAVEAHFDRAEAHPLAAADDAAAAWRDVVLGRDRETHGACKFDPVRTFIEIDQHRERMR